MAPDSELRCGRYRSHPAHRPRNPEPGTRNPKFTAFFFDFADPGCDRCAQAYVERLPPIPRAGVGRPRGLKTVPVLPSRIAPTVGSNETDTASNVQLVRRLLGLAWRYRRGVILLVSLQMLMLVLMMSGLGLTGLGIDVIGWEKQLTEKQPQYPFGVTPPAEWGAMTKVLAIAGGIVAVGLLRFVLDRGARLAQARVVEDMVIDLRSRVYDKLQRLSFRFFDANASGSLINRVAGDVQRTRMFVDAVLVPVLVMIVSLVVFTTYMASISPLLTAVCLASTPLLWLLTGHFSKVVKPAYRENRRLMDHAIEVLTENVSGVRVVKGFSRQRGEIDKFSRANQAVRDQNQWIFDKVALYSPVIGGLTFFNLFLMLVFGGWLYINDPGLTFGELLVFSGLLQQFSNQVANIAQIANNIQASLIGAARVFEVMDTPVEIASPPNPVPLERAEGAVRFEHVSFAYEEGEAALRDIDFEARPGQSVAILGPTGAGKSTLMSLIPRFYDPTEGRVLIDGRDAREYDLDDLRKNIGIVFQESFLFSNTVAANIAFGHPDASPERIRKAAEIAQAHGFISRELSKGYDTLLTESGANLSGGQRQRLALARAILLEPPILLMDDPTAAIDPETEHEILEAMDRAMQGRTTFVVAHRLSTLRRADLVVVLDRGRVIEYGTHQQLMQHGGHYRHAADLQLADDEDRRLLGQSA